MNGAGEQGRKRTSCLFLLLLPVEGQPWLDCGPNTQCIIHNRGGSCGWIGNGFSDGGCQEKCGAQSTCSAIFMDVATGGCWLCTPPPGDATLKCEPGDPIVNPYHNDGHCFLAPVCSNIMVRATWVDKGFIGIAKDVSFSYGVSHSYTHGNAESWGHSTTISARAGFSFFGFHASTSVSGTTSHQVAQTFASTFETSNVTTITYHYQIGELWQLQFDVTDSCGNSTVFTDQLIQTPNHVSPPCCLPGYFQDPLHVHGPCATSADNKTFDLCEAMQVESRN